MLLRPLGEMNNSANVYCACRGGRELDRVVPARLPANLRDHARRHRRRDEREAAGARHARRHVDVPPNPYPHMTVVWNPLAVGVPAFAATLPRLYPARRFFDAYSNDYYDFGTYSFNRTAELYDAYPDKPFVIPEWGMAVDDPGFTSAPSRRLRPRPPTREIHQLLQRRREAVRPRPQAEGASPLYLQALHRSFDSLTSCPGRNAARFARRRPDGRADQ